MNWETMAQITAVAGGLATVFHFAVLRPLNETLMRLNEAVKLLRDELRKIQELHQMLEIKVAEIDQRARSAHERLDELMRFIKFDRP